MARATKAEKNSTDSLWEAYFAAKLKPEQMDALYAEARRRAAKAHRDGVYERALEIVGTVKWSIPWQDLRLEE